MIKKLKDKKGSAMQVAIITTLLVGIFTSSVTSMVINQTKSNIKSSQNTDIKYETEKGTEELIAEFIEEIKLEGTKIAEVKFNMLLNYTELADILVASKGIMNTTINNILEKMVDGTVMYTDMVTLCNELESAQNIAGGSNESSKELLNIAENYSIFIRDNFFNQDTGKLDISNLDESVIESFILEILNNLVDETFITGDGTLGSVYNEVTLNNTKYQKNKYLDGIYKAFFKSGTNLTDKIKNIDNLSEQEIKNIIKEIENTDYKTNINSVISNIKLGGYIDEKALKGIYSNSTTGKVNMRNSVEKRLNVVESEIDMLIQWLEFLIGEDSEDSSSSLEKLIVSVPKEINIDGDNKRIRKATVTQKNVDGTNVIISSDGEDTIKFEVLKVGSSTKILLNLKVESEVQDDNIGNYKIESNVVIKIHRIVSKDDYKVTYEIQDWNKVNTN